MGLMDQIGRWFGGSDRKQSGQFPSPVGKQRWRAHPAVNDLPLTHVHAIAGAESIMEAVAKSGSEAKASFEVLVARDFPAVAEVLIYGNEPDDIFELGRQANAMMEMLSSMNED